MKPETQSDPITEILATPDLVQALEDERFKQFLDHVPVAIAVSELHPSETITYANLEFEALTGLTAADVIGGDWTLLPGVAAGPGQPTDLGEAIDDGDDYIGSFIISDPERTIEVDAWSNSIEDEDGTPLFRLVALAARRTIGGAIDPRKELREKAALLMELQHRVKNNLQIITTLIRMEARSIPDDETGARFERLAGRVSALALLYKALSGEGMAETVDLGVYLSQVASSVMAAHAIEGLRLELKVDSWPVSINVAMPAGLVVNELMTNALKHAFVGRKGGVISLTSVADKTGCRVVVSDDGVGLPDGTSWPTDGKLGAVIVRSLRENAKAVLDVVSKPGEGVHVTIFFARTAAQKDA
ncbi:sensor histidine kinase [Polymorphobacter fuscus]|uniref:histidine kinase n=1 Tax=Sandarakinorhabdus fusca TaxID=1439888 RepID=A0A7C9KXY5_9SPHN|nr:histidine kinase dimerization/phosphoacceptor domain -containing protein [Polymorphobacter fuscus]KAB7646376.1 PAS domain-containing protein [Polymorphobacter fuscus]MQT17606.1 PAS domain-containing protein [Polymorphobacter fuscus]NJC09851.1 two-component sensor histidine kinase [Polymorphobacter fuscus]